MTVALVANVARPISSAISTAFSADSYGALSSYGLLSGSAVVDPDAVIEALFANSEQGAWYDPSDLTTMFQDRAGTTPVTADGQTVGKILDKSGRGNHATAPNDAARPLYKTSGGLHWLQFDGVDDSLSTENVNFTATDEMSVFAGHMLNSDSVQVIYELSEDASGNAGSFNLYPASGGTFNCISGGTTRVTTQTPSGISIGTHVSSSIQNISGPSVDLRVDGVSRSTSSSSQGTGSYGNYKLFIGARANNSLYLVGNIYSLIVLGRLATPQEITDTETWVADKTGVTL